MVERRPITTTADKPAVSSANGSGAAAEITLASPLSLRISELEKRISAALADASVTAASLANLLQQTEWALPEAEQYAASERDKSLDPTASPDPRSARAASEDAQFAVGRLKTLQPRLRARHLQVYQQEAVREYLAKLADLAPQRDALARELRATYEAAASKLLDVFSRVGEFERHARQRLGSPPANCAVLERIDVRCLDKCVLPELDRPDQNIWPPRSGDFAASFAASMIVPQGPGQYWADPAVQERRRVEIRAEQERMALHAEAQAKQQLARENEELKAQFQARQNGRI
jgi:hypothetical protein